MVRQRLGESETKRLQLVITEDEIASIDDWRFANRIDSRSEAIRRLVQIGLRADARALGILEASRASLEGGKDLWLGILDELENPRGSEPERVTISVTQFRKVLRLAFEAQEAAGGLVADALAFHPATGAFGELEKAIATRDEYKRLFYERGDREHEE